MYYHLSAFVLGFLLDRVVGDPFWMPHPIRWIGTWIATLEKRWLSPLLQETEERNPKKERGFGALLVATVLVTTGFTTGVILVTCYRIHLWFGTLVEAIMTCYILAAKSLRVESMKVYEALKEGDVPGGRTAVSMIVGRDTQALDAEGIAKAAVETVAENTSDGVIAPLIYTCLGGPILGMTYKAVNTMDSMVGYQNDRYQWFGTAAALLDDIVNYVPSRISALAMVWAACLGGEDFSGKEAWRIFCRDRYQHKSPNSAQTESACAGALGLQLAGPASYFGKTVEKPFIGDATRTIEVEDIRRANRLMYATENWVMIMLIITLYLVF